MGAGPVALLLVSAAVLAIGFVAGLIGRAVVGRMAGTPRLGLAASTLCGVGGSARRRPVLSWHASRARSVRRAGEFGG